MSPETSAASEIPAAPAAAPTVDAKTAAAWLSRREAVLVDVREPAEFAAAHIDGAALLPLSKFDPSQLPATAAPIKLIFQCRSGTRARQAAGRAAPMRSDLWVLDGGIEAWKQAGLPTIQASGGRLRGDIQRQTMLTIGALALTGTLLGAFLSPWFLIVPGFLGGGMIFAGVSGVCGLAMLIARMPWNQSKCACTHCR
jgi:rhodanese-related sulfurtransferase